MPIIGNQICYPPRVCRRWPSDLPTHSISEVLSHVYRSAIKGVIFIWRLCFRQHLRTSRPSFVSSYLLNMHYSFYPRRWLSSCALACTLLLVPIAVRAQTDQTTYNNLYSAKSGQLSDKTTQMGYDLQEKDNVLNEISGYQSQVTSLQGLIANSNSDLATWSQSKQTAASALQTDQANLSDLQSQLSQASADAASLADALQEYAIRRVAGGIGRLNRDRVYPAAARSGPLGAEIQRQVAGDHPVGGRVTVTDAIDCFVTGHGNDFQQADPTGSGQELQSQVDGGQRIPKGTGWLRLAETVNRSCPG